MVAVVSYGHLNFFVSEEQRYFVLLYLLLSFLKIKLSVISRYLHKIKNTEYVAQSCISQTNMVA